jgi:antitoxin PrlF
MISLPEVGYGATRHITLFKADQQGQTTIPLEVRKRLKLKPGDRLEYRFSGDRQVTLEPGRRKISVRRLYGILAPAPRRLTIGEMNDAIAEAAVERATRR